MDRNEQIDEARRLGTTHGRAGIAPYGDLDDAGAADLMTALGETGWTTEANHGWRVQLCGIYRAPWQNAAGRAYRPAELPAHIRAIAQAASSFKGSWS